VFETHNSGGMYERMRIDHSGNVGIGTTAPADILQVRAAANKSLLVSSTANTANAVRLGAVNDANSAYVPLEIDASMTNFLGGNVGIGTTLPGYLLHVNGSVAGVGAYNQLSDERYKKDIDDISDSLEKVLAIHGVTYKWIDEKRSGSETQIGVIAQEIEKVVPEVVTTGSDGVKRVRYSDLVPIIIEALKREHADRDADSAKKIYRNRAAQGRVRASQGRLRSAQGRFLLEVPRDALLLEVGPSSRARQAGTPKRSPKTTLQRTQPPLKARFW
jgi:hypothetical protein